jgi:hypothetical protein
MTPNMKTERSPGVESSAFVGRMKHQIRDPVPSALRALEGRQQHGSKEQHDYPAYHEKQT